MSKRDLLPQRRRADTFMMEFGKQNTTFAVTVGYYPDGRAGEVFVSGAKAGSEVDAITRDCAVLLSIAIQHGAPLATIKHAITREANGAPSSIMGAVVDKLTQEEK